MKWFKLVSFLPYIIDAVVAVEKAITGRGRGATKKQVILDSIHAAAETGERVPNEVVQGVSTTIDAVVDSLNRSGVFQHSTEGSAASTVQRQP